MKLPCDDYPVVLSGVLMDILQYNQRTELWGTIFDGLRDIVRCYEMNGQSETVQKKVRLLQDHILTTRFGM